MSDANQKGVETAQQQPQQQPQQYNQNEPHYYEPVEATQLDSTDGGGGRLQHATTTKTTSTTVTTSSQNQQQQHQQQQQEAEDHSDYEGDEDAEADSSCMHPMHMAVFFFSLLAMIFCIVALATPNSYVVTTDYNEHFGIFNYKNDTGTTKTIKFEDRNYTNCEVRTASQWETRQQMSQVAIVLGAVFSFVACLLTFAGNRPGHFGIVLILITFFAFSFIFLGVLRLVYTYERWLYCDTDYCTMARRDPALAPGLRGCTSGFGYSFALLVIGVGAMLFSFIFAVMRVCFADWYLRKANTEAGRSRKRQVARRYEDEPQPPLYQQQRRQPDSQTQNREMNSTQNGHQQQQQQQQPEPAKPAEQEPVEQEQSPAAGGGGEPKTVATPPRAVTPRSRSPSKAGRENERAAPAAPPRTPTTKTEDEESPTTPSAAAGNASGGGPAMDDLPPGNWVWDEECGLYWSEDEFLYLDPNTKHYYDPKSDKWYNPETDEWYEGTPEE